MPNFSTSQRVKCVLWLAELKNIPAVQKRFQQEYCEANPDVKAINPKYPSEEEIRRWYAAFETSGAVNDDKPRPRFGSRSNSLDLHTTTYEKEKGLMNFFGFKKIHKCHPFKMRLNMELEEMDVAIRKNFAQAELDRIHRVHHLYYKIWFGGEAIFYTNGRVECHNLVYLAEDTDAPPPQDVSCVTVLAALNAEGLLGPYIFAGKPDKDTYKIFLRKFVYELRQLQRLQMKLAHQTFMHDDSPLHIDVKGFLNEEFPEYWVGPGSHHTEFPRLSPDLNPLAFFLWGHIKNKVYETPIPNDDTTELSLRIHHAFTEILPEMLEAAVKAYKERLRMVVEEDGNLVDVHEDDEHKPTPVDVETLALMDW